MTQFGANSAPIASLGFVVLEALTEFMTPNRIFELSQNLFLVVTIPKHCAARRARILHEGVAA